MNRKALRTTLESTYGPHNSWGERITDTALVWAARAEPGVSTLVSRRQRRALLLTTKRFLLLRPVEHGKRFATLVEEPLPKVEVAGVRRVRPMVQVRLLIATEPWIVEFRPRDRRIASGLVDALDRSAKPAEATPAAAAEPEPEPEPAAAPPPPEPPPAPVAPGAAGGPAPRPEMLLTVLAMGDPSAVPAFAEAAQSGFPPPPDPRPLVDRLSVRNVANRLRERTCTPTEAQRWAAVVQRALRVPDAPLVLDPYDPFPDQLAAGILVYLNLDANSDPDDAASRAIAAIEESV